MTRILLYGGTLLLLSFWLLPFIVHVELSRKASDLQLRLTGALGGGLIGIGLLWTSPRWRLHPVLLRQSLNFLSLSIDPRTARPPARRPPTPTTTEKSAKDSVDYSRFFSLICRLYGPAVRLIWAFPGTIALKKLHLQGQFGFDDPARTGSVFGYLQSLRFLHNRRLRIDLLPNFVQSGFKGRIEGIVHLYPWLLFYLLLCFGFRAAGQWLTRRWRAGRKTWY